MPATLVNVVVSTAIIGGDPNVHQGENIQFKFRVTNAAYPDGNNVTHNANGTFVQSVLPGGVSGVSWTAAYFGGATGPASGTGNLATSIPVFPSSSYAEFTLTALVGARAGLGLSKTTALASVANGFCLSSPADAVSAISVNIIKRRSTVTVNKIGTGPFERGRSVVFTIEVINTGPNIVNNGAFTDCLPEGLQLKDWAVVYANGASGPASGCHFPFTLPNLPVGGKATVSVNCWIEPDVCLGALTNTAKFFFPADVTNTDGSSCQTDDYDFQVVESTSNTPVVVGNCLTGWATDDVSTPTGWAIIRLVTPNNVPAYDPARGSTLVQGSYQIPIDSSGCWESPGLPLNSQLVTVRTGEPIPSFYEVYEYAGSTNPAAAGGSGVGLVSRYRFRLSSDNIYVGTVNVRDIDELNPARKVCLNGC